MIESLVMIWFEYNRFDLETCDLIWIWFTFMWFDLVIWTNHNLQFLKGVGHFEFGSKLRIAGYVRNIEQIELFLLAAIAEAIQVELCHSQHFLKNGPNFWLGRGCPY